MLLISFRCVVSPSWTVWVERASGRWYRTLTTKPRTLSAFLPSARDPTLSQSLSSADAMDRSWSQEVRTCLDGTRFFSQMASKPLSLRCLLQTKTASVTEETHSPKSKSSYKLREIPLHPELHSENPSNRRVVVLVYSWFESVRN